MKVEILKSFPYSPDGNRIVTLEAGAEAEIADGVFAGLEAEGFVRRPLDISPHSERIEAVAEAAAADGGLSRQEMPEQETGGQTGEAKPASSRPRARRSRKTSSSKSKGERGSSS